MSATELCFRTGKDGGVYDPETEGGGRVRC